MLDFVLIKGGAQLYGPVTLGVVIANKGVAWDTVSVSIGIVTMVEVSKVHMCHPEYCLVTKWYSFFVKCGKEKEKWQLYMFVAGQHEKKLTI